MTENKKIYKLNVASRLTLLSILPNQGDVAEMIVKEGLKRKLLLSKKEIAKFHLGFDDNGNLVIAGDEQDKNKRSEYVKAFNDYLRQYCFDELETQLITKRLKALADKKEITDATLNLYRWFVDGQPCEIKPLEPIEPEELSDYDFDVTSADSQSPSNQHQQ